MLYDQTTEPSPACAPNLFSYPDKGIPFEIKNGFPIADRNKEWNRDHDNRNDTGPS
jgi:hypothetical protein